MARSVHRAVRVRLRWKKRRYASRSLFRYKEITAALWAAVIVRFLFRLLRSCFVMDWSLGWSCSLQQPAFIHGHHEGVGGIGSRLALEVETGAFLGNEPQRNFFLEGEGYIRLLGVDVVRAPRNIKLLCGSF